VKKSREEIYEKKGKRRLKSVFKINFPESAREKEEEVKNFTFKSTPLCGGSSSSSSQSVASFV
jgi:hypothetical protein